MQTPNYLIKGDKVGIIATARKISIKELEPSIKKLQEWGFEVVLGNNLLNEYFQFAGIDDERAADFQKILDDDSIKAIIVARGGYGSVRIIDKIDFTNFTKHPKWIIGFSDVTVLHAHIHQNFGIETLHAPMSINFQQDGMSDVSIESIRKALFGETISYKILSHSLNKHGSVEGLLIGGNLSIIYSLNGSVSDIDTKDKILFIEDLDEYLYHIDRMIMNLKRSGKLTHLKGMIVGSMTKMKDNAIPFGKSAYEIIADAVMEFNYPVCFDFPAGHIIDNRALILGREIILDVKEEGVRVLF